MCLLEGSNSNEMCKAEDKTSLSSWTPDNDLGYILSNCLNTLGIYLHKWGHAIDVNT